MRRLLLGFVLALVVVICLNAGVAKAAGPGNPPAKCFRSNAQGDLPTCTESNGQWQVSYPSGSGLPGSGSSIPGWFIGLGILIVIGGIAITVWRVSLARGMATRAGLSPNQATAVTLLDSPGLDAAYLAANLQAARPSTPPADDARASSTVADRLRDLASLRDQSLITDDEYATRRQAIINSL